MEITLRIFQGFNSKMVWYNISEIAFSKTTDVIIECHRLSIHVLNFVIFRLSRHLHK